MATRKGLRASDADREHIAERLRNAAAEGRLLAEELEDRLGKTFKARTYGELDAVVSDLPANRVAQRPPMPFARPALVLAIALAAVAIVAFAVLVITGLLAVWALWAFIAWWMFGGRHPRRRHRALPRGGNRHRTPRHSGPWQVHGVSHQAEREAWL
jgi:Flp pilus assembly protein TadB